MQRVLLCFVAVVALSISASAAPAAPVDPTARTVKTPAFTVQWSATDPEEILSLSWNGSANLTNTAPLFPYCPGDSEFFGNSWDTDNDVNFASPVGWGTTGTWMATGQPGVGVMSSASGCFGTSGIPVQTRYRFADSGESVNTFTVRRSFFFGATPFTHDLRPYIPRLFPRDSYSQVIHPDASGTSLVTEDASPCDFGCRVTDWNGTWFAVNDPTTGAGMIVLHQQSRFTTALWVDMEGASATTASSVALVQPPDGFRGTVTDVQAFCFYDAGVWKPSLTLPAGCDIAGGGES